MKKLNWFAIALVYVAFFGLIAVAVWITKSGLPLFALLLTPSFPSENDDNEST
jgi:hypothetical protein